MLLVLYLAGAALVLSWPGRAGPVALRAAVLVVLLADLLVGSYPVTDTSRNPDLRSPREHEWVDAISRTTEPLRLSRANHIHPQTIYRYGWGVVDGESTFAPAAFLDLYAVSREAPRLQDLLNVRYVLPVGAGPPPAPAKAPGPLRMWPGAVRRLGVPGEGTGRQVEIHSHLVHGVEVRQGQTVATLHLLAADGTSAAVPLRAGIETAEWSLDRPATRAGHGKPAVSRSWPLPEGYQGHTYHATADLPRGFRPAQLLLEGGTGPAVLVVERLTWTAARSGRGGPSPSGSVR